MRLKNRQARRLLAVIVALWLGACHPVAAISDSAPQADQPSSHQVPTNKPVLHLANGDFCIGELADSDKPEVVHWNCSAFGRPFDFRSDAVSGIDFPRQRNSRPAKGDFCVELAGGDILFGSLDSFSADQLVLNTQSL